jgi:hypothetical protein
MHLEEPNRDRSLSISRRCRRRRHRYCLTNPSKKKRTVEGMRWRRLREGMRRRRTAYLLVVVGLAGGATMEWWRPRRLRGSGEVAAAAPSIGSEASSDGGTRSRPEAVRSDTHVV